MNHCYLSNRRSISSRSIDCEARFYTSALYISSSLAAQFNLNTPFDIELKTLLDCYLSVNYNLAEPSTGEKLRPNCKNLLDPSLAKP